MDREFAARFAADWIAAWNAHDLDRILAHYEDDFEMSSPVIRMIAGEPSGTLRGKTAIRAYWAEALRRSPHLHFKLITVMSGADSVTLCYEGHRGPAAEVFHFSPSGKVRAAFAHYANEIRQPAGTASRSGQPVYVVDAFAGRPFEGNPAAVCPLTGPAGAEWMQSVAAEMNLAETAFLHPDQTGWNLRWFTPTVEVDLCGHATLAAAHVLWESGRAERDKSISFQTRSGTLSVIPASGGYEMDFPSLAVEPVAPPSNLAEVLGSVPVFVGGNGMDLLVELADEREVRSLKPDLRRLAEYPVRGVIVTARSAHFDFVSRFFAPASGVPEDPVTGSAHCALGPYWAAKLGRDTLTGFQASARGGRVGVVVRGDRVMLSGAAVTVLSGELLVEATSSDERRST